MIRFVPIAFFSVFIAVTGFSQRVSQQVFFVDTSYTGFNTKMFTELTDSLRKGKNLKIIYLESQYDPAFTMYSPEDLIDLYASNEEIAPENIVTYTPTCQTKPVQIIDSIDITGDGVKEIFLFHESSCYLRSSHEGPYGEGSHGHDYGAYEVWDVQSKKKIAEIENFHYGKVAVSTNVIRSYGYKFDVKVTKSGEFIVSGDSGQSGFESGTYVYNKVSRKFEKKL